MQGEDDRHKPIPPVIQNERVGSPDDGEGDHGGATGGDPNGGQEEDRRPTPVRMVMEGGEEDDTPGTEDIRTFQDVETGDDWVAKVAGRSTSGILPLRTVPLLEITFARAQEPSRPLRQALGYGTDLGRISDQELLSLFTRSDPFKEPIQEPQNQEWKGRRGKNRRGSRG